MVRLLITAGALAVASAATGCDPPPHATRTTKPKPEPAKATPSAKGAKKEAAVAVGVGVLVSTASAAAPPPPPKPAPRTQYLLEAPPVIKFRAVGSADAPHEMDADEVALASAAEAIEQRLAQLDPPIAYRPTPNEVKNEYVRGNSRQVRPPDAAERAELEAYRLDTNRVYVEYEVELSPHQVREIRTRDRVADTLRVLGVLTAGALAAFLFLRLDEWTRGYLTRWLAIGAVALAAGAVVGVYLL